MCTKIHVIICNVLMLCVLTGAQYTNKIRVMTYNINAEKHSSGSYKDIADVINEIKPDIAGLQKLDSCNSRNSTDVLKWLGEQSAMKTTYAPAIKNYENSGGSYGVGFLSKETPLSVRRLWMEHTTSEQDRAVLQIDINMGTEEVRVIVTHLAHEDPSYRTEQIKKIIKWIDSADTDDPVIIMADFNAKPTESSMKLFETAGYNYVKGQNGEILDTSAKQGINHIMYRPLYRWNVKNAGNPAYSASNRNPVWADMEVIPKVAVQRNVSEYRYGSEPYNITSDNKSLWYTLHHPAVVSISFFDFTGRKCTEYVTNQGSGSHAIPFSRFNLASGNYHCMFCADGVMSNSRVMIAH
ncbi:MAG TPA: endonuclease/exonuclease/phosphatase family protein [Chitinispirillaceae bacterium]|nr:endonuclease/exonuclease/phosphatase family protein [Chitinispirillaceae bacterium]